MSPGPGVSRTLLPQGFFASGVNSGVRRYRPDLGLIYSETDCVASAVYTLNQFQAAPILYCRSVLPSQKIRAIVTNSGQANAATGLRGLEDNQKMVAAVARELKCDVGQVLSASTGVIGVPLAVDKIEAAVPELCLRAGNTAESFALAILTTDLVPKTCTSVIELSEGSVRLTGICKGSGMIHPNMGTMLGYFLTDLKLSPDLAQEILKTSVDDSFNMISVDGDCSTNDCAFLLANGATGVSLKTDSDLQKFKEAFTEISEFLAKSIASDGEGATKLIEVHVHGAPEKDLARRAARSVVISPLVKSAMHGEDPNWGRILARLGAEQVPSEALMKLKLKLQDFVLFENGLPCSFDKEEVRKTLRNHEVFIDVDLGLGKESAVAWGCDLTKKYVEINTEYS
ncbi:MAG: bifunctional glutamate N-acetyltransferase/amino-acid acetyltransferase ArgJ [Pseudobdellovibrionaceae bacterium]